MHSSQVRLDHSTVPTPAPLRRKRILVVDDNSDVAEGLALLLQVQGHEVRVVQDGPSALSEQTTWKPDVVFLDICLPCMDGWEVARQLRARAGATLRLVALTGHSEEEDRRRALEAGFDDYLVKPATPEELRQALDGVGGAPAV